MDGESDATSQRKAFLRREKLGRFLTARMGNGSDAVDLLQEMFVRISRADIADEARDAAAYLFRMAMNVSRDYRRERARARAGGGYRWADAPVPTSMLLKKPLI
jgi:DNA-directed RNA polymerase specialized sigma24 family protein